MAERVFTINLRKELLRKPKWKRTEEAVKTLKDLLRKRTKAEEIKISKKLNEKIWKRGMKNPLTKIRVRIVKIDDKTVRAEPLD